MPENDDFINLKHDVERHERDLDQQAKYISSLEKDVESPVLLFKHLADASTNPRDLIFSGVKMQEHLDAKNRFYVLLDEMMARREQKN
jgi:hypothetical protein